MYEAPDDRTPAAGDLERVTLRHAALGDGLTRRRCVWRSHPRDGGPPADVEHTTVYSLTTPAGPLELELPDVDAGAAPEQRRLILTWPDLPIDLAASAAQLLTLADLLNQPKVRAALAARAIADDLNLPEGA